MNRHLKMVLMLAAAVAIPSGAAMSEETPTEITVTNDQSRIVQLPAFPGTVIVGNPIVADATVEGKMLVLHARGFGLTNVIVLDQEGRQISELKVRVGMDDTQTVSLFRAGVRETYNCRPTCEPEVQIGDEEAFNKAIVEATTLKSNLVRLQMISEENTANSQSVTVTPTPQP